MHFVLLKLNKIFARSGKYQHLQAFLLTSELLALKEAGCKDFMFGNQTVFMSGRVGRNNKQESRENNTLARSANSGLLWQNNVSANILVLVN